MPSRSHVSARFLLWLGCASLLLSGCDRSNGAPADGPAGPPEVVRLGYFAGPSHAQAVLGVSSGDFARAIAPSKLSTSIFNAGPAVVQALFAGEIDIAYLGPGPAINAFVKSHGQGIRIIAGSAANGVVIVARPGSGIHTLADLKGKRIATPQVGNTQDLSCRHYMIRVLHQSDADNVLAVASSEQAAMMSRGQIDASWAPEPWASRLIQQAGAQVIAQEKDLWPDQRFSLTVVVTTPEFLARHPDIVRKFLSVHRAWTARLQQDSARYVPALGEALEGLTGKRLPEGVLGESMKNILFTDEPVERSLQTFAEWTYDLGFARQRTNLAELTDLRILKQIEQANAQAALLPPPPAYRGRGFIRAFVGSVVLRGPSLRSKQWSAEYHGPYSKKSVAFQRTTDH